MRTWVVCALVSLAALATAAAQETYDKKYDNFDVDEVLNNERLLKNYINCILDRGRCTREGTDFKRVIPEALQTNCAKCSPRQRQSIRKVVRALRKKNPDDWTLLQNKADPEKKYTANLEAFLNSDN